MKTTGSVFSAVGWGISPMSVQTERCGNKSVCPRGKPESNSEEQAGAHRQGLDQEAEAETQEEEVDDQ